MTIRTRTDAAPETSRLGGTVRLAGLVATVGLAGAGALHGMWASGSTWPAEDAADLADLVVGRVPDDRERSGSRTGGPPPVPGAAACAAVAGLLGTAALLTAGSSGLIPWPRRARGVARLGARVAAGVLFARGGAGLVVPALATGITTERFRRWNLRLYSPLCLGLGGAAALSTARR